MQFDGKVQRIARVHHYGLRDRVSGKGPKIKYSQRRLLGLSRGIDEKVKLFFLRYLLG